MGGVTEGRRTKVTQLLIEARDYFLADPGRWIKPPFSSRPESHRDLKEAVLLPKGYKHEHRTRALWRLGDAIDQKIGRGWGVTPFNDRKETTFDDIIDVLTVAIDADQRIIDPEAVIHKSNPVRNAQIWADRVSGMTFRAISAKHGVGVERVRQIYISRDRRLQYRIRKRREKDHVEIDWTALIGLWSEFGEQYSAVK